VRLMIPRLGEDFSGKVVGMVESGMFVQLDEPYVEGLLPKDALNDDSTSLTKSGCSSWGEESGEYSRSAKVY